MKDRKVNIISKKIFQNLILKKLLLKSPVKSKIIFLKSSVIPRSIISEQYYIHKGLNFRTLHISKFIVGLKFGEFVLTRKPFKYIIKSKKKH